jgi:hypothetical protein
LLDFEISVSENPPILQEIKELEIGKADILSFVWNGMREPVWSGITTR